MPKPVDLIDWFGFDIYFARIYKMDYSGGHLTRFFKRFYGL
jgi:hypothetical protein